MSERSRLLIALAAAFGLVLLGGVITHLAAPAASEAPPGDTFADSATSADSANAEPAATAGQPGASAEAEATEAFEARERRYRQLIEEANRRLRRQQRALDEARRRLEAPAPAPRRDDRGHGEERESWEPSSRLAWNEHEHEDHEHEDHEHEDHEYEARDDD